MDRSTWQQSPHSQTGWFPLQVETQQPSPTSQTHSGWLPDVTSHDHRAYESSPMYASAPTPYWMTETTSHSPQARFLPSPAFRRPESLDLYERVHQHEHKPSVQTVLRHNKQIAIGRWNTEEHQWFLKGLEMFQGPAWGEIARLIGSRTSTQVRTHAQKFFTKLARLNQTMPYFETQIQKERARLVAQGASVTPTAQSAPSASLSPRKRLASATTSPLKRFKDEGATTPTYYSLGPARYPQQADFDVKPRLFTSGYSLSPANGPVMTKEWSQSWAADEPRQWSMASPTSTAASLQLTQLQLGDAAGDAESLPSMNKLLYRSTAA